MNRRDFLQTSGAVAGLAAAGCNGSGAKPNILWIFAEDFSPDLGCYGNRLVKTPNLDRLAQEGVRYTNCICTAPVCSAARSALMVGMFQTSVGGHNHRSHRDDGYKLPEGIHTHTYYFRQAGYHTSNSKTPAPGLAAGGKTDFNYSLDDPAFDGEDWSERAAGQPFYAQINFSETHRAFKRFEESPVNPDDIELAPYYPDHPVVRDDIALYLDTAQHLDVKVGKVIQRLKDEGVYEDTIVFFFGDHGQALHRGKQWLYEQGILIPLIVRIPEKSRPDDFLPGSVDERLMQHIDIAATSLKLAGIDPPSNMQGRICIGPDAEPEPRYAFSARDRCDETVDRIRSVRTKRWKLIRNFMPERPYSQKNHYKDTSYPTLQVMRQLHAEGKLTGAPAQWMTERRPDLELFDLESDPHEIDNLAESPQHTGKLAELTAALDEWIEMSNDQGRTPEYPLPAEYAYRTMVDGWYTNNGLLAKAEGMLKMEWSGRGRRVQEAVVPYVTEGGDMTLTLELRSTDGSPTEIRWGTAEKMRGAGKKEIGIPADGRWRRVDVSFSSRQWLTYFAVGFGGVSGRIDCRRAVLRRTGSADPEAEWTFA